MGSGCQTPQHPSRGEQEMLGCGEIPGIIGHHGKPSPPSHSVTAENPGHTPGWELIKAESKISWFDFTFPEMPDHVEEEKGF